MSFTVTWLGCDLVTGQIMEELPDLIPSGNLSALLGAYTSAAFTLPVALGGYGAPPRNWIGATEPGRTMVVAVVDRVPIWAGIVLTRKGGTEATVDLGCVSLEGYLERRYVGNHTYLGVDEASVISAGLIDDANTTEGIGFVVDAPSTGTARDRSYFDQDDKTVYSAMQELMGVLDGPEWTVVLDWTTADETAIRKTIQVRKRIGFGAAEPAAIFSTQSGSEARYAYQEAYTSERGANHIVATSSGEGTARPQSAPARDAALFAAGWPRYEYRYSPASSIVDIAILDGHAANTLALFGRGARTLSLEVRADAYPSLGVDWALGDNVGYDLIGHRHPAGLQGSARVVGWNLDPRSGIATPILLLPGQAEVG